MKKLMKKICLHLLIFSFFNYTACYSSVTVDKEKLFSKNRNKPINDITIVTKDDKRILINEATFEVLNDTVSIEGVKNINNISHGQLVKLKIALSDIQTVEIEGLNESKTTGCIVGLTSVVLLTILLAASANKGNAK